MAGLVSLWYVEVNRSKATEPGKQASQPKRHRYIDVHMQIQSSRVYVDRLTGCSNSIDSGIMKSAKATKHACIWEWWCGISQSAPKMFPKPVEPNPKTNPFWYTPSNAAYQADQSWSLTGRKDNWSQRNAARTSIMPLMPKITRDKESGSW